LSERATLRGPRFQARDFKEKDRSTEHKTAEKTAKMSDARNVDGDFELERSVTIPFACALPAIHATQERNMHDAAPPAPFLKWAGGKCQLSPRILALAPARIATYCFASSPSARLTLVGI